MSKCRIPPELLPRQLSLFDLQQVKLLQKYIELNLSTEEIGQRLCRSGSAIRQRLRKLGLQTQVRNKGHENLVLNREKAIQNSQLSRKQRPEKPRSHKVVISICNQCGQKYTITPPSEQKSRRFCSRKCYHAWSKTIRGKDHPNYRGQSPAKRRLCADYKDWREEVLAQWDYTCQLCGQRGGKLICHHLDSFAKYPEKRTKVDNGIVLCHDCHQMFHSAFGARNNTQWQFYQFCESMWF